jgi:hypothetical protein
MKRFYLFTVRGITDRFFCGNIYEALPTDTIKTHGHPMTFQEWADEGVCKAFDTRKQANDYSRNERIAMEDSNNYANRAMESEEVYGCEGVDDMRFEN